ncbi:MAG TPA: YtxH domain-containing protein [Saprospiraceae bacterium]|nr:YtxH domain-containing protein [Saprospiraceae bacterium]
MSKGKVILGALAGLAAGAIIGILLAPDKGDNTRKKISKRAEDFTDGMKSKLNEVIETVKVKLEAVKDEVIERAEKAKDEFNKTKKGSDTAMNN